MINSNNISLRAFEKKDIANKVNWINDSRNNQFLHYDIPLNKEKTLQWYKNKNNRFRYDCVIEVNNKPVGVIGLLNIDQLNHKAEYYITIGDVDFKGKGVATQATHLILKYAFKVLNLNKVYLNVDADNIPAVNFYKKFGFVQEGYFKEDLYFKGKLIDRIRFAYFNKFLGDK